MEFTNHANFCPINFKDELNEEQYAAVSAPDGPALVLAGAGSGKTRTLTYRVAWLLLQRGVPAAEILLLTFTNKAAREMLGRVSELTGQQAPRWGGTFHSVGARILRIEGEKLGLEPGFTILDQGDAESLLKQAIEDVDKGFLKNKDNPKHKALLNLISYARNTRQSVLDTFMERYPWYDNIAERVSSFAKTYAAMKHDRQVCDYDDLLELWLRLLKDYPEVAQRYSDRFQHVLVDEYQDTNLLQSEIVDRMGSHHNIMAVGDDAQCIYTWRGANFENITNFEKSHPGAKIYKIQVNYRSTPQILDLANGILDSQSAGTAYQKELRAEPNSKKGLKPFVVPVMDTRSQARVLIQRIRALYEEGRRLSDIAILYRAHYQAMDAQLEMSRDGIPFVITSGIKFFEQAHVRDLVAMVRFVANPRDSQAFERFCALLPKVGPKTAQRLYSEIHKAAEKARREKRETEPDLFNPVTKAETATTPIRAMQLESTLKKVPKDARDDWEAMAESLIEMEGVWKQGENASPREVVEVAVQGWYEDYLKSAYPNWESRRDDLDSLIAFAARYEDLNELLAQLVLLNSETSEKSVEIEEDAVRMTTIHQAKGLEFPVVFVIGLADGLLPLKRAIEDGDTDEERRLFYVAATRAEEELYLCYPMMVAQGGNVQRLDPSRFLREIPESRYEMLRTAPTAW